MPQEFIVVRCFNCEVFQVEIVKKKPKWKCKMCGEHQSVRKIYGEQASAKDCRIHVQKLNALRGELGVLRTEPEYNHNQQDPDQFEPVNDHTRFGLNDIIVKEVGTTKWNQFLQPENVDLPPAKRFKGSKSSPESNVERRQDVLSILKRFDVIENTHAVTDNLPLSQPSLKSGERNTEAVLSILKRFDVIENTQAVTDNLPLSPPSLKSGERNTETVLSILKSFDVIENTQTIKNTFELAPNNLDDLFSDEDELSEKCTEQKSLNAGEAESLLRPPMFETCDFDEIDFDL